MAAVETIQLPVSQRPEWQGFTPLEPEPLVEQVVSIAQDSLQDAELLAYFYAAVAAQERSQRVLDVTIEVPQLPLSSCMHCGYLCMVQQLPTSAPDLCTSLARSPGCALPCCSAWAVR